MGLYPGGTAAVSDGSVVDHVFQLLDHGSFGALVGLLCIVGEGLVAAILPQAGAHLRQQRVEFLVAGALHGGQLAALGNNDGDFQAEAVLFGGILHVLIVGVADDGIELRLELLLQRPFPLRRAR